MRWYEKGVCLIATAALLASPARAQQGAGPTEIPAAAAADVQSIDAVMKAVYDVISGPAGQPRDWDRMRSLFVPGARLIPVGRNASGQVGHNVTDVEGFISRSDPYFQENGFFEREIARRVERFGHIAHAFSTYESYHNTEDAEPFVRGINSFQLYYDDERWWIVTIYWEAESPDLPIPKEYLP